MSDISEYKGEGASRRKILTRKGLICTRCEILLTSRFAGSHDGKYCEDCLNHIGVVHTYPAGF